MGCQHVRRYSQLKLAGEIARRWITTVEVTYTRSGLLYEKYDIENPAIGQGGDSAPQIGFGWIDGVTADLIDASRWRMSSPRPAHQ